MSAAIWYIGIAAASFFLGFWRGQTKAGRNAVDYWLTSSDGRVNWTRATAAVGLGAFVLIILAFLHVYVEKNGVDMSEELLFALGSAVSVGGINLGQFLVSKKFPAPPVSNGPGAARQSGAVPAPPP